MRAVSTAIVVVNAALGAAGLACIDRPVTPSAVRPTPRACARPSWTSFVTGVNVIDRPDDRDDDPRNDGARGYGSAPARSCLHQGAPGWAP